MELLLLTGAVLVAWLYLKGKSVAQGGSALPVIARTDGAPAPTAAALSDYGSGPSITDQIAQAIYQMEGNSPGNIAYDNNNPGNLKVAAGATGVSRGFPVLPDFSTGWSDLENYIQTHVQAHPTWDFYDFFQNYLGQPLGGPAVTAQGNSDAYAEYVAAQIGVDPTTPISALFAGVS